MADQTSNKCNPIQYFHKGIPIRKYNLIHIRIDEITYKEIIDVEDETGLSIRKILSLSSAPCDKCIAQPVIVLTDNGTVKIKRGILSKRIPMSYGNKKRSHENGRKVKNIKTGEILPNAKVAAEKENMKYNTFLWKLNHPNKNKNNTSFIFYEQDTQLRQNDQQIPR